MILLKLVNERHISLLFYRADNGIFVMKLMEVIDGLCSRYFMNAVSFLLFNIFSLVLSVF